MNVDIIDSVFEDKVVVRKLIATADESVPNLVKEATIEQDREHMEEEFGDIL